MPTETPVSRNIVAQLAHDRRRERAAGLESSGAAPRTALADPRAAPAAVATHHVAGSALRPDRGLAILRLAGAREGPDAWRVARRALCSADRHHARLAAGAADRARRRGRRHGTAGSPGAEEPRALFRVRRGVGGGYQAGLRGPCQRGAGPAAARLHAPDGREPAPLSARLRRHHSSGQR
eukprot:scaffold2225_cov26-Phaeocystis_antarctica.AAC.1